MSIEEIPRIECSNLDALKEYLTAAVEKKEVRLLGRNCVAEINEELTLTDIDNIETCFVQPLFRTYPIK